MSAILHREAIDDVITRHLAQFRKPGVLTVRPGIEISGHRLTGRPSIVATVMRKSDKLPVSKRLPDQVEGLPVDVREASPMQRLRQRDPAKHALMRSYSRSVDAEHDYPYERDVKTGKLVAAQHPPVHAALAHQASKPEIAYTPASAPLRAVSRRMTLLVCASPDAGFTVLQRFLVATRQRLTVGMYDFTSARLLDTVTSTLRGGRKQLTMVLDHPILDPVANQTDEDTIAAIHKASGSARTAWALSRPDPRATKWIFPYAYHIKVAVRDGAACWLSSGNWNVSNQPDLASKKTIDGSLASADRDWHVVMMDPGMARLFEAYLQHDFEVASAAQAPRNAAVQHSITVATKALRKEQAAARAKPVVTTSKVPFTLGRPRTFTNVPLRLQPLLTPDHGKQTSMYVENVLALIRSAKKTLYVQMQYINPSLKPEDKDFMLLIAGLRQALERHVDVRIICSQYQEPHLEAMYLQGLSGVLRIQQRVHNKGIVVDSRTVMVSSQNWSAAGTLRNRDAGVIIEHAGIARYFEAIFLQDWASRSEPASVHETAPSGRTTPRRSTRGGRHVP
ncbi:MAG: hypothetical protein IT361_01840 [Gemmatimonadaceae bacterium]|nr:hypothetical protein [Gemmatimonadaceae bacterium]